MRWTTPPEPTSPRYVTFRCKTAFTDERGAVFALPLPPVKSLRIGRRNGLICPCCRGLTDLSVRWHQVLWFKSRNSEMWLYRRTNYTRSLAVMSMVGYVLGLGDRHPSNLVLHRRSGKILHIDFGDCFEVGRGLQSCRCRCGRCVSMSGLMVCVLWSVSSLRLR